jgi:sugar lactone lactonase YvrE
VAGPTAIAAMNFLAHFDALVIDLRNDSGGQPSMIRLLSGYFLEKRTHLGTLRRRYGKEVDQSWTADYVQGQRLTVQPIYILVSKHTFSAAEMFAYNLQSLGRATIVGEVTRGGANPTAPHDFPDESITVDVPYSETINPITKRNFNGMGVIPDIQVLATDALDTARIEALKVLIDNEESDEAKIAFGMMVEEAEARLNPVVLEKEALLPFTGSYDSGMKVTIENGVLSGVAVEDNGDVYLLDSQLNAIHVYSSNGEFVRTIGREGEGPGEFRGPGGLFVTGDGEIAVIQRMPGKIVLLTPKGDAAGNHPVPEQDGAMMFSGGVGAGDQLVLATEAVERSDAGNAAVNYGLIRIDSQGNQNANYWKGAESLNFQKPVFDEKQMNPAPFWGVGADGRVFISDHFDDYAVQVFNGDGTPNRIIERDFELRKRSDTEKEWRSPTIAIVTSSGEIKNQVIKSKTDRTIQGIYPQPNGDLWVLSSRGAFDAAADEIGSIVHGHR